MANILKQLKDELGNDIFPNFNFPQRTLIPTSANLNSATYRISGHYRAEGANRSNCPTTKAFIMDVFSTTGNDPVGIAANQYVTQSIMDSDGDKWERRGTMTSATAITWGAWAKKGGSLSYERILGSNSGVFTDDSNTPFYPTMGCIELPTGTDLNKVADMSYTGFYYCNINKNIQHMPSGVNFGILLYVRYADTIRMQIMLDCKSATPELYIRGYFYDGGWQSWKKVLHE